MLDVSAISNLITVSVAPGIQDYIQNNVKVLKLFEKGTKDFDSGGNLDIPVQTAYNQSFAFTTVDGALPFKGSPTFSKFTVSRKLAYSQFQISGEAIRRASKEKKLAVDMLMKMQKDIRTNVSKQMERVVFGLGTGRLGVVSATNGTTTITLNASNSYDRARYIKPGMRIGVADATNSWANLGNCVVSSVNHSTQVVTVDSVPGSTAANDVLVLALQESGEFSYGKEIMGLGGIVDDGTLVATFQNVTRSSNSWANGNVYSNSGTLRSLTRDLIDQLIEGRELNSGIPEGESRYLICNRGILNEFITMYEGQIQMSPGSIQGGAKDGNVSYQGYNFIVATDCPYYRLYDVTPSTIKYYLDQPFAFIDKDGNVLQRDVGSSNRDNYVGTGKMCGELVCEAPTANSVLTDLTQTVHDPSW